MKLISGKKLCKIIEKLGWQLKRVTESHPIYTKENKEEILVISVYGNRDLPVGTLKKILRDADLTENDI